jgi:hypothetical protein
LRGSTLALPIHQIRIKWLTSPAGWEMLHQVRGWPRELAALGFLLSARPFVRGDAAEGGTMAGERGSRSLIFCAQVSLG